MAILFSIYREGRDFYCTADGGPRFFVGRQVPYKGNIGLYNVFRGSPLQKLNYSGANYLGEFGFWAEFIEPTAWCEGRNFLTINSYDRAAFTFGFGQFAAHVENGDFVHYFRRLLGRPEAREYFPSLDVIGGRIHKIDGNSPRGLESDQSTQPLMDYLNPTLNRVEDEEVIAAAKFIHWTARVRETRLLQIEEMVRIMREHLRRADARGLIDGKGAGLCCVVADVLHNGRGLRQTWPLLTAALRAQRPLDALLEIGAPDHVNRRRTLRAQIGANPRFAEMRWNSAAAEFE